MIAAIGAFDGFHKGHQSLLRAARIRSEEAGTDWGIVTFEFNPDALLSPPKFKSLYTIPERKLLETFFRVPTTARLVFTKEMSQMTPARFLDHITAKLGVRGVVVGEEFRFGKDRSGTTELLASESRERGWTFDAVPLLRDSGGEVVSSTAIRKAVAAGDMAGAWKMQGYPFFFAGRVVHGNERGRVLEYPTANLNLSEAKAPMRHGVYATIVRASDDWYVGAANAGLNPTFGDVSGMRFEVNLLDFDGDLYGREITVFIIEHIRDEIRFDSADSLKVQMREDARVIREKGTRAMEAHLELWNALKTIEPLGHVQHQQRKGQKIRRV